MLDLKRILVEKEKIEELLSRKGYTVDFTPVIELDAKRKAIIADIEKLKAENTQLKAPKPAAKARTRKK